MRRHRTILLAAALLIPAAIVVYLNSLPAPFLLDDIPAVVDNSAAHWPPDLAGLFGKNYWGSPKNYDRLTIYRPLATLSFALTDALGGATRPWLHRLLNVLLHAGCTLLVFLLGLRLPAAVRLPSRETRALPAAAAAFLPALLFAVHPAHTEAVVGVVSRCELLAAFFVLLGTLLWLRIETAPRDSRIRRLGSPVLALVFALALLSKENGATLWAVVIGGQVVFGLHSRSNRDAPSVHPALAIHIWLAIVLAAYFALRAGVLYSVLGGDIVSADNPIVSAGVAGRLLAPFRVFLEYIRLLVLPVGLTIDYSLNHLKLADSLSDVRAWAGLACFLGGAVSALVSSKRHPAVALAIVFFFGTYAVVSNIPFLSTIVMAERLIYLPSAFFLLVLVTPLYRLISRAGESRTRAWVAGASLMTAATLTLLFSTLTITRNADWRTPLALYSAAVRAAPDSAKSRHLLAGELYSSGRRAESLTHYLAGAGIDPDNFVLRTNCARNLAWAGRYDEALSHLEAALTRAPRYQPAFDLVCAIYERTGKPPAAGQYCFPSGP